MSDIDIFAGLLLEESKRFLEKATVSADHGGKVAYLHASLLLCFASFEAHLNAISDDFGHREDLDVHDRAIMFEREVKLKDGRFELASTMKMYRLEDRVQFVYRRFSGEAIDTTLAWWAQLQAATNSRNGLTHPKVHVQMTERNVSDAISAVVLALGAIYRAVYHKKFPAVGRGLDSKLDF